MAESVSTVSSTFPVNAKSRKSKSLYPCNSLSQNHSCMNRPDLGSELSCTYARNYSTSQAKNGQSIKENEDSIGVTELSSSESHGDNDLVLGLDLTLRTNLVDRKHASSQPNSSISILQSAILTEGMEQERISTITDFRTPALCGQDNNNKMCSDSRNMVDAVGGFQGSYQEAVVGQLRPVQCSASGTLNENQQETPAFNWNEAKHLAFSRNSSKELRSFATNHSGMDDLCNLSHDEACQLSSFDPNLTDNHLTSPRHSSITRGQVISCPPIRVHKSSLLQLSGENRQGGAMAGSIVQAQGNSSYVKVKIDGFPIVQAQGNSSYVKVKMDGFPIFRKVDMNAYGSYESLAQHLENMFQRTTEYLPGACIPLENRHAWKPLGLLDPASDFILTYEDTEGDCMLATDVPWKIFLRTVKRLRIKKNSGIHGFAQKCSKKRKTT